ncbi:MAG: voltage-gated potassium channel, partial [Halieaceae bacterium]
MDQTLSGSEKSSNTSLWKNNNTGLTKGLLLRIATASKRHHFRALLRFILILATLVTSFSLIFQAIMALEEQRHSLVTGFYWTLSTMSTLGYGDIAFKSDLGRIFSIFVLLSGIIFMLVLLPVTFIELFWEPWMKSREVNLVPRHVPESIQGHVILTFYGPVASALIEKLVHFHYPYVVILPEIAEVIRLREKGIYAIYGELNDPETYQRARVEHAALVATTRDDISNTSVVFTVRGITTKTLVIATAREDSSVEILKLSGCNRVLDLTGLMAEALARRAIGGPGFSHVVGQIDDLLIAEVDSARTKLVGKNYLAAQAETSVSIVGFWARGNFQIGQPESTIETNSVLLLAGSRKQLHEFDANYRADNTPTESSPVIIIGGGRVGRSTAASLKRRGIDYRIVEVLEERIRDPEKYVFGSGSDKSVLQEAGIADAPTIIITPRDDETNIYLAIYCRLLRPDIQIICRATLERNVAPLHRAGSDIVMSYASMGANALFNLLQRSDLLMIAEGLDVFKVRVSKKLAGKTLAQANFRAATSCSVIGIDNLDRTITHAGPDTVLPADSEIILIGT